MVAPFFRESAFVWACIALMGGCALTALMLRQRKFLLGLSERFVKLPPSTKAVIVTAVVVATVFAQKPVNVSTNQHESVLVEQVDTAHTEARSHGESEEWVSTNQHESTQISIRENPCQSVDKDSSELRVSVSPCEAIVSSNDVVRGYRLETVRTNATDSFERPANARLVGTWHLTDAYEAVERAKLDGTRFPIGSHVVTSLWAHTWGKVRPQLRNASNEIVVVGAPMFARHDQSYLWTAATTNGSVVLTWENFFLGNPYERSLATDSHGLTRIEGDGPAALREGIRENPCQSVVHPTINAQLELFPNGDFIARSNEVERVYRRINPDDWDDDGIPNEEDTEPFAQADEPQFGPHQTLLEGANADAYCWVDLVVRHANAKVTFTGDGESDLADPAFIAEADATNRVTLLIGKTYRVTCPMPFEVIGKSSDEIKESWEENGAALWLHWPVSIHSHGTSEQRSFSHTETRRHGVATTDWHGLTRIGGDWFSSFVQTYAASSSRSFTMQVSPSGLGGAFTWTNVCCRVSGSGYTFSITCGDDCSCGGCTATGYLEYEGYRLPAYGGFCGCGGSVDHPGGEEDPDEKPPLPGAAATFSKSVVFFEDEYENAPGKTVPWRSTETELDCWAYGGTRGGHVRIEIAGADGLVPYGGSPLPFEQDLESGEEVAFKITYRAVKPSGGKDDIVVTATFTENETGWTETTVDKATAIRLKFEPVVAAPENRSIGRHTYGVCEEVRCEQSPSTPNVSWVLKAGKMTDKALYKCPLYAAANPITASCAGVEYTPTTAVIEPRLVTVRDPGWDDFDAPVDEAGSIVMMLPLYIGPMNVSFFYLAVEEVPHEIHPNNGDIHTGYFARKDLALWWHHTRLNGAGVWRDVDRDTNRMGEEDVFDQAGVTGTLSRVNSSGLFVDDPACGWSDGRIVMATPFGWNVKGTKGESLPYKMFAKDVYATLELQSNGTFRVEKLANEVIRHVDGSVFLNGVKMK